MAVRPAGQDSEALIAARNGDSTAPFAPERQFFLDNLRAGFGLNGSCFGGSATGAFAAPRSLEVSRGAKVVEFAPKPFAAGV